MDRDIAQKLISARVEELDVARRRRGLHGAAGATLADFCRQHLIAKKEAGEVTDDWLAATQGFLQRAVDFLGADRDLDSIRPSDVREFVVHLRGVPVSRGGDMTDRTRKPTRTMSTSTLRAHLFALGNLYRRAQESEVVPLGYNPVAVLMEKPAAVRIEAKWLDVPDAALLLEAARTLPRVHTPAGEGLGADLAYPLLATFLLTGGRLAEVLGLEVDDLSLDRATVTFRPNTWRRVKTKTSWRVLPMWPQLAEILRPYIDRRVVEHGGRLLFPSFTEGAENMLVDTRKLLDRVARRVGWKSGEIRHRIFRHTYCAARLQTLDRGAPVSIYTVSRELGHQSEEMVKRVYAHLGSTRHRAESVEYRVEQHQEALQDRLGALGPSRAN